LIGLTALPSRWPTEPADGFLAQLKRYLAEHGVGLVLFVGIGGALAAIAYPSFTNYEVKAVQSEAGTNLGGIFAAEKMYYEKHKRYGTFEEIGFEVTRNTNRYTYRIEHSGKPGTVIPTRGEQALPDNTVTLAGFSATGFTATATGNIDDDTTLDQWHVNDQRQGLDKADVDDVTQ
jgi:Tfp pilus assembly protein PilE